ncbi:MAG: cell division protein FtsZ, partial [Magnetospirillum sp.]
DDVLYSGVRGVTDLMIMPGLINLDFADIRTVMSEMGKAMMGTGEAEGDKRAIDAAEAAISNPLLDDTSMKGAKGVLINITGGLDMTLFEVDEAANRIRDEVDPDANIIFGSTFDEKLNGKMRVSVVATGIASEAAAQPKPTVISLVGTQAPAPQPGVAAPPARPMPQPVAASVSSQQPQFRPQVMTPPAAAQAQPQMMSAHGPHHHPQPQQRAQAAMAAAAREPELDIRQPEPQLRPEPSFRPEPQLRSEPALSRSQSYLDSGDHDMHAMQKAVSGISQGSPDMAQPVHQEPRRAGSLLDRLVNRGRQAAAPAAAARAAEPAPPQPRMEARRESTAPRSGEDLDIPAFLRRQAN